MRDENAEIFATVSAEEYAELKQNRRAGNWIEGDEGTIPFPPFICGLLPCIPGYLFTFSSFFFVHSPRRRHSAVYRRLPYRKTTATGGIAVRFFLRLFLGVSAEGYSDDGEEWWQSDSGSEDGESGTRRAAKRRGEEGGSHGASPEGRGKRSKKGSAASAADLRAKGMRSLLQHFSSMATEKGVARGPQQGKADSAKQLQALKSIEASLDLDDEEEEMLTQKPKSSISSSSSSSSGSRSRGPLAAADGFGLFGLGARLPTRVPGSVGPSGSPQGRSHVHEVSAASAAGTTATAAGSVDAAAEATSMEMEGNEAAAATQDEPAEEAEDPTTNAGIFKCNNEHFITRRKMMAVDLFAQGEETAEGQEAKDEGSMRPPMLDESLGASEGLPVCADGSLPFYLLDAWDDAASGAVYLFGKVWQAATQQQQPASPPAMAPPQSCCVVVRRMMRPLFFFLKKQVSLQVGPEELEAEGGGEGGEEEIRQKILAARLQQKQENAKEFLMLDGQRLKQRYKWNTWKCKATTRHYAFDAPGVPRGRDLQVVKVFCPGNSPAFDPEDMQGLTYSHVFGSSAPLTEVLIVKRKIKGPCWLKITGFTLPANPADKASWCRHEVIVEGHKQIRVWGAPRKSPDAGASAEEDGKEPPAPPLTLLSLTAKSISINNNPTEDRALCMAAFYVQRHKDIEDQQAQPILNKESVFCAVRRVRSGAGGGGHGALGAPVCARAMVSGVPPSFEEKAGPNHVQVYDSERVLLTNLVNRVYAHDPDIILGHNIYGADLELLARRCLFHGLPLWHKLSRLKRPKTQKPPCSNTRQQQQQNCLWGGRVMSVGRLVCDTYLQARELLGHKTNYNLLPLLREAFPMPAAAVGGGMRAKPPSSLHRRIAGELHRMQPFPCEDLLSFFWAQDPSRLLYAANLCCLEAYMSFVLAQRLNCLPVTRELTIIGGNLWARSLQNARAERNAFLLMHAFHAEKFVYPDPPLSRHKAKGSPAAAAAAAAPEEDVSEGEAGEGAPAAATGGASRSKGPAYAGGLVLEPRVGLYDSYVLLLDFNSLYPSIIQEFNVCFSTVRRPQQGLGGDDPSVGDDVSILGIDSSPGLLPRILQQLVEKRRHVKAAAQKEKDPARKASLDVKQLAMKLTANSIYGCLGFSGSRFYAKPLAAYITQQGRSVLMATKDKVEQQLQLSVLYGDTDSIMVSNQPDNNCAPIPKPEEGKLSHGFRGIRFLTSSMS